MEAYEKQYANLVRSILHADKRSTRNGATLSEFGKTITVDLQDGFPLLRGRKLYYNGVFGELAAMLRKPKHIYDFKKFGCNYWDKWADKDGYINILKD